MRRVMEWLFRAHDPAARWWGVILWWEKRRIPFNLIAMCAGVVSLAVFLLAIECAGGLEPGEDAVEPLALIAAPVLLNIAYTAGWILEVAIRLVFHKAPLWFGPVLLGMGLASTLVAEVLPAAIWVGIAVVEMVS